jgi:hypothetical protein
VRRLTGAIAASALATGFVAGAVGMAATASAATAKPQAVSLVAVTNAPELLVGDEMIGAVKSGAVEEGAVALRPRSQAAITSFIQEVSTKGSPLFHQYLSQGQYAARFGPTSAAVAAVRSQLLRDGLRVASVSSNRLLVNFSGSASAVESAFHTGLDEVRLSGGGTGQITTSAVRLPSTISNYVQAVIGLNQLVHETDSLLKVHGRPHATPGTKDTSSASNGPVACASALALEETGAIPDDQLAKAYGLDPLYDGGDLGAGQTIDLYELEPFLMSDLTSFDNCYFPNGRPGNSSTPSGAPAEVTTIDNGPGTGPGVEAALDLDNVSAIAPGAVIHVFQGPNMNGEYGELDTWNAIAVADDAKQISSSWGICETALQVAEPGAEQVEDNIFEQTAAQGQSVFQAAGDDGSDTCAAHDATPVAADLSVMDPGGPYVTLVGGTTVLDASTPPVETVWNNGTEWGAGGGGISEAYAEPTWQVGLVVPQTASDEYCSNDPSGTGDIAHLQGDPTTLPSGTLCREGPDVSALADPQTGYTIVYDGGWYQYGGTSASTPLWAAITAEMNAYVTNSCHDGTLGFISPLLYGVASGSGYSSAFNDIVSGNNDNLQVGVGDPGFPFYQAGPGFDMASGLGTPKVADTSDGLVYQLCAIVDPTVDTARPAVSGVTPDNGPLAGGGTAVIAGSNFGATKGSVYFGTVQATVTHWTATAITVDVPALQVLPGTPAGEGSSEDVTVTLPADKSSSPGPNSVYHYTDGTTTSPNPVVDYLQAPAGNSAGGNAVTIVGSGFTTGGAISGVTFGGVPATNLLVLSDDELQVTAPAETGSTTCENTAADGGALCQVQVIVTNSHGSSAPGTILPPYTGPIIYTAAGNFAQPTNCGCEVFQAPGEYDYASTPTVTSVSPQYASEYGGTVLAVSGTGFSWLDIEWVNIGTSTWSEFNQDFSIVGISPTQLDVVAPSDPNFTGTPTVNPDPSSLSVQTAAGLSNSDTSFAFAGVPEVNKLTCATTLGSGGPCIGAQSATNTVTITGGGFDDATSVEVAGQDGLSSITSTTTNFTVNSNTSLTVTLPQFFAFATDVLVCSATGCDPANPAVDTFIYTYPGRPVVSSSSPRSGPEHGRTLVTIQGSLDSEVIAVDFGTLPATIVSEPELTASGPITVLAPISKKTGKVDITITTVGGSFVGAPTSATTRKATFTYDKSTPSAPQDVTATGGKGSASVTWTAPVTNGGYSITDYLVVASGTGLRTVRAKTTSKSEMLTGLKAGGTYTIAVVAGNKLGYGLRATAGPVTVK